MKPVPGTKTDPLRLKGFHLVPGTPHEPFHTKAFETVPGTKREPLVPLTSFLVPGTEKPDFSFIRLFPPMNFLNSLEIMLDVRYAFINGIKKDIIRNYQNNFRLRF